MREIPLTKGLVALVDDADYEFLSQWKWYASFEYKYYAVRWSKKSEHGDGKRFKIRMHRVVMGLREKGDELVDHKDNSGLNNQRSNLEVVSSLENMHRVQNWRGGRTWKTGGRKMRDDLGERMKEQYELRTRYALPRRTYTVIRVDGKAFHTLTKNFERPFDKDLMEIMDKTAIAMCKQIQGVCLAYTQSDEISLILTDFATPNTDAWYDGNIQKMASVSASIATAAFNKLMNEKALEHYIENKFTKGKFYGHAKDERDREPKMAFFDSRVFSIPDVTEVYNYLIWRQQDASRNSIQAAAQALYSQKELHGKNTSELQEMMFQKGVNWNDYTSGEKRGRAIVKETHTTPHYSKLSPQGEMVTRNIWVSYNGTGIRETPLFTADKEFLKNLIPLIGATDEK